MKKRSKISIIFAAVGALLSLLLGLGFALSCSKGSGVSYLSGLCVVPFYFGLLAAIPAALLVFTLSYLFYPLFKSNQQNSTSTGELLSNPKAFENWQRELEEKQA